MHWSKVSALVAICMVPGIDGRFLDFVQGSAARRDSPQTTFEIPRIRQPDHVRNGAQALRQVYDKYNWDFSASLAQPVNVSDKAAGAAMPAGQTASLASVPEAFDAEYLSPVQIGTPPQTLHLDLDTGSSDFWVFSTLQPANETEGHDAVFNKAKSSTWRDLPGASWNIKYGDESGAYGLVGTDTVGVSGVAVPSQAVELAQWVSDSFVIDPSSDGIIGLGFDNINSVVPQPQKQLFDNLKPLLKQPLFGVDLRNDGSGAFGFGFVSNAYGPLAISSVDPSNGYWQFASPVYSINGNQHRRVNVASVTIADTGTSLIILDPGVVRSLYDGIDGAAFAPQFGGYVFPCNATLPTLGVAVGDPSAGGRVISIPPSLLSYAPLTPTDYCYGAVQSNNGNGIQVLGDVMFRAAYVVFYGTVGSPQIGVAQKNEGSL